MGLGQRLTDQNGGITNPFYLREDGTKLFKLINTRNAAGITEWTAPPGATVAGGSSKTYIFGYDFNFPEHLTDGTRVSALLTRIFSTPKTGHTGTDTPSVPGMALRQHGDIAVEQPLMAVLGEPLDAMVSNLGQADNGYVTLGDTSKVLAQRFTTGANETGYRLQGIGVNIEGSDDSDGNAQIPDGPASVSVAVHADSGGQPGDKLFDLVSPGEYAAGHSFFEAPAGKDVLEPNTSYVVVWSHLTGTSHRLRRTSSDSEDSGGLTGFSVANALYSGADTDNLSADSGSNALEIVVYGSTPNNPATGRPTVIRSEAIAGALLADTSGIRRRGRAPRFFLLLLPVDPGRRR